MAANSAIVSLTLVHSSSFVLSEDDPNYIFYADGHEVSGQPIKFYVKQADQIKQHEKTTM